MNLDGMWPDELQACAEKARRIQRYLRARHKGDKRAARAWRRLSLWARYAETKSRAMVAREAGSIRRAIHLEQRCDAIYDIMPRGMRW